MARRELSPSAQDLCRRLAATGTAFVFAYLTLALHSLWPVTFRLLYWLPVAAGFSILCAVVARRRRNGTAVLSSRVAIPLMFGMWATLIAFLAADLAYGVYYNRSVIPQQADELDRNRPELAVLEFNASLPRMTRDNLNFYKPGFTVSATVYGDLLTARDLESPVIREHLCEFRTFDLDIDEHGCRSSIPRSDARAVLLGDSFAFGASIQSELSFAGLLNRDGRQCCNLGHPGTGLVDHYAYLAGAMQDGSLPQQLDWIIWSVFEGNDLEDSRDPGGTGPVSSVVEGTLPGVAVSVLETIRDRSVLSRALSGELYLMSSDSHRVSDGVHLRGALYDSTALGRRLFYPPFLARVQLPENYVVEHPNLPRIERTFRDMRTLAEKAAARVVVVLIPSAPRVHGPHFDDFPALEEPHFLNFIRAQAEQNGFEIVDLLTAMKQESGQKLFYFRDDTHFNRQGHALTAREILAHLDQDDDQ